MSCVRNFRSRQRAEFRPPPIAEAPFGNGAQFYSALAEKWRARRASNFYLIISRASGVAGSVDPVCAAAVVVRHREKPLNRKGTLLRHRCFRSRLHAGYCFAAPRPFKAVHFSSRPSKSCLRARFIHFNEPARNLSNSDGHIKHFEIVLPKPGVRGSSPLRDAKNELTLQIVI